MTKDLQKNELGKLKLIYSLYLVVLIFYIYLIIILGSLTIGADINPFSLILPPQTKNINVYTYCAQNCVSKVILV